MADDKDDTPEEIADVTEAADPAMSSSEDGRDQESIWMRALWMVILAILFGLAETLLLAFAVLQFFWMLFAKEKNQFLSDAGETMGKWMHAVARFQTAATEDKPFPWRGLE